MAFSLETWKKYRSPIIWGLIVFLLGIFFIRVAVWENNYYKTKEGSMRAESINNAPIIEDEQEEIEEIEPSAQEVQEYHVSPEYPRYLSIPKIGVQYARVKQIGLTKSGALATPANIFDVGWYTGSSLPGSGGTLVIDGHNGASRIGVFKYLPNVEPGDSIYIERGDGVVLEYIVYDTNTYSIEDANKNMYKMFRSPISGQESLSLITCTGEWPQVQNTYLSRQFVRAVIKSEAENSNKNS